ncbi:enoyl-CoA hydratase/isomerase family protein [Rhodococcus koreensis]
MSLIPQDDDATLLVTGDLPVSASGNTAGPWLGRVLQLNRAGKRNALTTSLLETLQTEIENAQADRRVRAIIMCGSGGTFCAGGDVNEFEATPDSRAGVMTRSKLLLDVAAQLERSPLPTLAAVTGPAVGAGAVLALACDMAIATPDARLGFPELRSSVVPSLVMPSAVTAFGRRLAFDLLTSGRFLDAHEAIECGVINRVVDPADLRQTVMNILSVWASVGADAMTETKGLLNEMHALSPSEAGRAGLDATAKLWRPRAI